MQVVSISAYIYTWPKFTKLSLFTENSTNLPVVENSVWKVAQPDIAMATH